MEFFSLSYLEFMDNLPIVHLMCIMDPRVPQFTLTRRHSLVVCCTFFFFFLLLVLGALLHKLSFGYCRIIV